MGWGRQFTRELYSIFACRLRAGRGRSGIPKIRRLLDLCRKACHGVPLRLHVFGSHFGQVHVLELTLRRIGTATIDRNRWAWRDADLASLGHARGVRNTGDVGNEPSVRIEDLARILCTSPRPAVRMAAVLLSDRGWPLKRWAFASTEANNSNVMTLYLESGLFFVVFTQPLCDHTRTNR